MFGSLDYPKHLELFCSIVLVKPRGGRAQREGKMIYLGRGVANFIKVVQDEILAVAVICPLAKKVPLNKR
jgi:hypothetical protein